MTGIENNNIITETSHNITLQKTSRTKHTLYQQIRLISIILHYKTMYY